MCVFGGLGLGLGTFGTVVKATLDGTRVFCGSVSGLLGGSLVNTSAEQQYGPGWGVCVTTSPVASVAAHFGLCCV